MDAAVCGGTAREWAGGDAGTHGQAVMQWTDAQPPIQVESLPQELTEGMERGAGSQVLLQGPPSTPRDVPSCLGHAQNPRETNFGGLEMPQVSTCPAEGS